MSLTARARRPDSPPLSRSTQSDGMYLFPSLMVIFSESIDKVVHDRKRKVKRFYQLKEGKRKELIEYEKNLCLEGVIENSSVDLNLDGSKLSLKSIK